MANHELMVVGPNLPGALQKKGTFHVHTADCADLKRNPLRSAVGQEGALMDCEVLFDIVQTIYPPEQFDWDPTDAGDSATYWNDFHWAPCVKEIPTGFPEAGDELDEVEADGDISADDLAVAADLIETFDEMMLKAVEGNILDHYNDNAELVERLRAAAEEE